MGGRGSGGHNSKGKLRDVQCARLDVHELARDGKLTLGKRGTLFGTVWFEVMGGPDALRLVLDFPLRSVSGERLAPLRQEICCYWRQAHYGGRYLMFLCGECSRPARVLYARYFSDRIWFFNCRSCVGISYSTVRFWPPFSIASCSLAASTTPRCSARERIISTRQRATLRSASTSTIIPRPSLDREGAVRGDRGISAA
jgi:hypothetical protein